MAPLSPSVSSRPLLEEARTFSDPHTAWCASLSHPSLSGPDLRGRPDTLTSFSSFSSAWVPFKKTQSTETERTSKSRESVSKGLGSHTCRPRHSPPFTCSLKTPTIRTGELPGRISETGWASGQLCSPRQCCHSLGPSQCSAEWGCGSMVQKAPLPTPTPKNM